MAMMRGERTRGSTGLRRAITLLLAVGAALVAAPVLFLPTTAWAKPDPQPPTTPATPYVNGFLSTNGPAPSGSTGLREPGIYDSDGRFVLMHGVNAVYKHPPYELFVAPGKPWNFDDSDATRIARLGLNMVRVGVLWKGIEPGTAGVNNPAICTPGQPGDPHQWNQAVANQYVARLVQTVNLLGRYHIYSLIDMHQDVYSERFKGEGAPDWAVCTDRNPIKTVPGRWSNNYSSPALNAAFNHFWKNDVVGNLQGEYDRSSAAIASALADNPWVLGYDPINEPFSTSINPLPKKAVDQELQCFYTGSANPGTFGQSNTPVTCPPNVPAKGLIPTVQAIDSRHALFLEPSIFEDKGKPNFLGKIPFPNLALNFHVYCGARSPVTGNPYNESNCFSEVDRHFLRRATQTVLNASALQPDGVPLFISEFGATQSFNLVATATSEANQLYVGWAYWSWKYYNDPTGSSAEALVGSSGKLSPQAKALDQTYPMAVAGTLTQWVSGVRTPRLFIKYVADPRITAPTLIRVPVATRFTNGYCADVTGGTVISANDAPILMIKNPPQTRTITVTVFGSDCD